MVKLAIYDESKMSLGSVDFVNDTLNHVSLAEMSGYERTKQFSLCFPAIAETMRITTPITDFDKREIQELVLMKFKRLSVNEIYYAFRLERFGEYEEGTPSYNRFDSIYVAQILDKYVEWKREIRRKHNLAISKNEEKSVSDQEKQYWINKGVTDCLEYFIEHRKVEDGKSYIYGILYDLGFLPTDPEYKKKVHKDAIESLQYEYKNKKAISPTDKRHIKEVISKLEVPGYEKVTVKCHMIVLREFFQKLTSDQVKLDEFRKRFKNE